MNRSTLMTFGSDVSESQNCGGVSDTPLDEPIRES